MRWRFAAVLLLVVGTVPAAGHTSTQAPIIRMAMKEKLRLAQRLLEDVVGGDHAAVARHAAPLARLSEAEIASWQAAARPEYVRQASAFLLSVQGLRDAAARADVEVELAEYTSLVSSCTRCHAYVRTSRLAWQQDVQLTMPPPPRDIPPARELVRTWEGHGRR